MVVGTCRIALEFPGSTSLKEKRGPVRSIITRMRSSFNAAVAEVDGQDSWTEAILGVAVISNDARHANAMLSKIVAFVDANLSDGILSDHAIEILHLDD